MPESNLGLESSNIAENIQNNFRPGEYHILKDDKDKHGFRTDHDLKEIGSNVLREFLCYGYVRFHKDFFTCPVGKNLEKYLDRLREGTLSESDTFFQSAITIPGGQERLKVLDIAKSYLKEEIIAQFRNWKERTEVDKNGLTKKFYSGKYGGKTDDIMMCIIAASVYVKRWQNTISQTVSVISRMQSMD